MSRESLERLKQEIFDLVIVGGGIQGACLAWEGSRHGLKVALIEKGDFGAATSANSLKILHGGLRYLQHFDFRRMRESIASRHYFASFAPDLVRPLPCVIPTTAWGLKNPVPMKVALMLNDLISCKRNKGLEAQVKLPNGSLLSPGKCRELFPGIVEEFSTGGAKWYDYLILNSERVTLELVKAAEEAGAVVENYVCAQQLIAEGNRISGILASDQLNPENGTFEIRSKAVISCVGPWWNTQPEVDDSQGVRYAPLKFAKAINLVIQKKLLGDHAIGLEAPDPNNAGKKRFFFLVPWQDGTMIGTTYRPMESVNPDGLEVSQSEIEDILSAISLWFPSAKISTRDVVLSHAGLLPVDLKEQKGGQGYRLHGDTTITHHVDLEDSGTRFEGLFSVKTVKYTTSPVVAREFYKKWGAFLGAAEKPNGTGGAMNSRAESMKALGLDEGEYTTLLDSSFEVTKGDVIFFCRQEKAVKLLDVIHRRGVIDHARKPTLSLLNAVVAVMAQELDWTVSESRAEVQETLDFYESRGVKVKE